MSTAPGINEWGTSINREFQDLLKDYRVSNAEIDA
jgi:hypothetical protein